jgi:hypothetical protein
MAKEKEQLPLFEVEEKWRELWKDMPEFEGEDLGPEQSVIVHFASKKDRENFAKLIKQNITYKTQSLWYPKAEIASIFDKVYVDASEEQEQVDRYLEHRGEAVPLNNEPPPEDVILPDGLKEEIQKEQEIKEVIKEKIKEKIKEEIMPDNLIDSEDQYTLF